MEEKGKIFILKELAKSKVRTPEVLALHKRKAAKKFGVPCPSNAELLKTYHELVKKGSFKKNAGLENLLRTRKIRSLSGIVVVSVLTSPRPQWGTGKGLSCPFRCLYCPSQKGIPKSYLSTEPAVMRAVLNKFDPYKQVQSRIKALEVTGHPTDKIELRLIGGTWSFYPKNYQTWFIKKCFQACNKGRRRVGGGSDPHNPGGLGKLQKRNEKVKHRIIGITIETRPDFIDEKEIKRLRKLGVTRVELGVQSIYDDVLSLNRRGHKVRATIEATKLLKDAGFKVCYQMMPNLPGADLRRDEKMFEELFSSPDFQPDFLKIYPCSLLKEAPLYQWFKKGKYQPYKERELINLLKKIKKRIPVYCRLQRLLRDIPAQSIVKGPSKISNLRQIIQKELKKEGWKCKCIRCREVRENYNPRGKFYPVRSPRLRRGSRPGQLTSNGVYLFRKDYEASGAKEIFLSFEDKNQEKLYSLLRLRLPSSPNENHQREQFSSTRTVLVESRCIFPVLRNAAIIRELHTYGQLLPLRDGPRTVPGPSPQHKGMGKRLIKTAEKIAKEEFGFHPVKSRKAGAAKPQFNGVNKIAAISGIGVRPYWRKLGYRLKDTYMVKKVKKTV